MCKPAPGPRCSFHAHKEYTATISELAKAETESEKARLKGKLKEKELAYYTTPRGQNFLRRKVMFAETEDERREFEKLLEEGISKREQQLTAYKALIERNSARGTDSGERTLKERKTITLLKRYTEWFGKDDEIVFSADTSTLLSSRGSFLVVGSKHTSQLTGSPPDAITEGMAAGVWVSLEDKPQQSLLALWCENLENQNYTGVALLNYLSGDVSFLTFTDAKKALTVRAKLVEKRSGTNPWSKTVEETEHILKGAGFDEFELSCSEEFGLTVLFQKSVPSDSRTVGELLLSPKKKEDGTDFYVLRQRSTSVSRKLTIEVRPKRKDFGTYISEPFREWVVWDTTENPDSNS